MSDSKFQKLPLGSFGRKVATLASGSALAQVIYLAVTPLLTRLYTKPEFGALGIFLGFIGFVSSINTLNYEIAIPSAETESESLTLLLLCIVIVAPVSLLGALVLLLLQSNSVLSFGQLPVSSALIAFVMLLFTGVYQACRFWLVRNQKFREISTSMVQQGLGRAFGPVLLAGFKIGFSGLALGEAIGRVLGVWGMIRPAMAPIKALEDKKSMLRLVAKKYSNMPKIMLPSTVLNQLGALLPVPLIASYYGAPSAGLFVLVQRFSTIPSALVGASIADVFHSQVAQLWVEKPDQVTGLLLKTVKKLALLGSAILIPAGIVAPFVFGPVFGKEWSEAGLLFTFIVPWSLGNLCVSPVSRLIAVAGKNSWKLIYDFLSLLSIIGTLTISKYFSWSFGQATLLLSLCMAGSYLVYLYILYRASLSAPRIQ